MTGRVSDIVRALKYFFRFFDQARPDCLGGCADAGGVLGRMPACTSRLSPGLPLLLSVSCLWRALGLHGFCQPKDLKQHLSCA